MVDKTKLAATAIQKLFSETWWIVLLRGITALLIGYFLVSQPMFTVLIMVKFLGYYWFFDGIFTIFQSIKGRKVTSNWGMGIFSGIMGILAGVVIFLHPAVSAMISVMALVYIVSFLSLFNGVSSIITGIRLRKEIDNEWSMVLGGLLSTIIGVLLLIHPALSASILVITAGILAIVGGLTMVFLSFRIRKFGIEGWVPETTESESPPSSAQPS